MRVSALTAQPGDRSGSPGRQLAAACLAVVIVAGSALLWIGVPIAGFWVAGQLTTTAEGFLLFVLGAVPLAMVLAGWGLYRVSARYEALRGGDPGEAGRPAWLLSLSEERPKVRRRRARRTLIDVAMTASIVTALVLLVTWFFFLAEMRLVTPP